ncbi:MAG: AI-2E family transporter [Tropicimonas sp.]|uniref:AI-2E family transporter n=1 Tax=Tropicimonas sp. TaxID=2067044 RepID=UPI003A8755C2
MAIPAKSQVKIWSVVAAVILLVLWFLGDVILPFVLGAAIAYLLDPVADWLERKGLSRVSSVALITLFSLCIFILMVLLVIPALFEQATNLFATLPKLVENLQTFLTSRFPALVDADSTIRQSLASLGRLASSKGAALLQSAFSSVFSLFGVLTLMVIVPVVAFYLLLDWDRMVARVDDLLPRDHVAVIRTLAREVDRVLASFIRGQGTVCFLLGLYYCVALFLAGLDFGFLVGALAGLLTFIPYIGALVGGGLALGLALFQFWGDWAMIGVIAAIFFSGQMIEGNVLTPKLVGSSVGLHPVWLLLALSVFGSLFGFVGMLVAVPVSAAFAVIVRFAIGQYKDGRLYQGALHGRDSGDQ